jgi:hypothetical protein
MGTTGSKVLFDLAEQLEMNNSHPENKNDDYELVDKNNVDHNHLIILTNAAAPLQVNQSNEQNKEGSSHSPQQVVETPVGQ